MTRLHLCAGVALACAAAAGCESSLPSGSRARDLITAQVLGQTYLDEGRLDEAEEQFETLIRLAPDQPAGFVNLGLVHLQRGQYDRAEARVRRALELRPDDPDVALTLATVHQLAGREDAARSLLDSVLSRTPGHSRSLYALANLHRAGGDPAALAQARTLLQRLVTAAPANVVARLDLVDLLLQQGGADSAVLHLEQVRGQTPELPGDAERLLEEAIQSLRRSRTEGVTQQLERFRQFLSVTPIYQASIRDLWGPQGEPAGVPTLTLSPITIEVRDAAEVLAGIRFTNATAGAGLDTLIGDAQAGALAVGDYDGDGDVDLYLGLGDRGALLTNAAGRFTSQDIDRVVDLGPRQAARFGDYDNDGVLDLVVAGARRTTLLRNAGEGRFREARAAGLREAPGAQAVLLVDADHDGDLDLFLATASGAALYRNNLDGSFSDRTAAMGFAVGTTGGDDAALGDFDDDADMDLVVVRDGARTALFTNRREGRFEETAAASGLDAAGGFRAVIQGDYDNDGFLDLFAAAAAGGAHMLYRNRGDGTFEPDQRSRDAFRVLNGVAGWDAAFFDFDNDGALDLLFAGESAEASSRGLFLFHNDGTGRFRDWSSILSDDVQSGRAVALADYDGDGDLDVFVLTPDGRVQLLRNDGAEVNHYLKLQLLGLRTGSGKNNHFGIGSKVEVRAGDLYQTRVVTDPVTHFGLGQRLKADVVRIRWTNGVYQELFYPGSDQDLLEQQVLKGSCALLYAWDGERYRFVTDIMWRSALGMPLGIMTAGGSYAPPGASQEYLRLPPGLLRPENGAYRLQITEELWEIAYLDQVKLLVVDHPDSFDIYVDERFVPPAPAPLRLHPARRPRAPVSAVDDMGNDVLPMIRAQDDRYLAPLKPSRYQGVTAMHDLILDLGDLSRSDSVLLFLNGWIFPTDASINVAMAQSAEMTVFAPVLQVPDARGRWQTVIGDLSFPAGKNKTVVVDLTGKFLTRDYRVRIRTNMEVYWDHIFVADGGSAGPLQVTTLHPTGADLHFRGFSRMYRKGGRYGPHWFEYSEVTRRSPWGPITGAFTRFGDVSTLVQDSDDRYVIMAPGDEMSVTFDAQRAPALPPGWTRDVLIYTDGWIKDADLNTATGDRVTPLPFHAMSRYPYGPEESYPTTLAYRRYLADFNTRMIGPPHR